MAQLSGQKRPAKFVTFECSNGKVENYKKSSK